jgi:hypothetical protein
LSPETNSFAHPLVNNRVRLALFFIFIIWNSLSIFVQINLLILS